MYKPYNIYYLSLLLMSSNKENRENIEDEYLNQITLKYLTNLDYRNDSKDTSQITKNNIFNGKHYKKIYKNKEKKFYKKRIMNIVKLLINDEGREKIEKCLDTNNEEKVEINEEDYENNELFFPDIKTTFDVFIKTCINYLKAQDKCDIIQDDYKNLDFDNILSTENIHDNIDNNVFNKEINGLMMRKIYKKKNFIDSFVKRRPIELNIQNSTEQINKIIPHKKKINLHDPELKTKGLHFSQTTNNLDNVINENIIENIIENKNNIIYKEPISINTNDKYKEKCKEKIKKKQQLSDKKESNKKE